MAKNPMNVFSQMKNHQMQVFKEFDNMSKQMFKGFDDMFGLSSMNSMFGDLGNIHNEMRDMMGFSNIGNMMENSRNGPSKLIVRSYGFSTKLDQNGDKQTEKYFSNNYAMRGDDGTTVSERQQAYANSLTKQQKIAEERMINNRGKKLIQERVVGGPTNKTNHYLNMDEGRVPEFDRDWDHYTEKFGFYNAFGNQLGYGSGPQKISHPDYSDYLYSEPPKQERKQKPTPQKNNYTNEDPVYLTDKPNYGRVRHNDLQPTQVGRALPPPPRGLGRPVFEQQEIPLRPPQAIPLGPQHAIPLGPAPEYHGGNFAERRNEALPLRNISLRDDGNFRNKNVHNAMPKAG